ncbi:MAG: hypothetical protein E6J52_05140 [Chloroflexi bacterium]|nr:MAG: hypothetical protein E6J52_05140 [Chloroflexota bacterium]
MHPFYDGNGRTARALARLLLLRGGYAFDGLVSLDAYLDNDRRAYFDAIRDSAGIEYRPPYDATAFVEYFVRSIVGAADFVLSRVKGLTLVLAALRRDVIAGRLPARVQDGLVYAWVNGSLRPAPVINVHPALLPFFGGKGMHGDKVHAAVLAAKAKESGVTVHRVHPDTVDLGEVVVQRRVPVNEGDDVATLSARVLAVEHEAIVEAVRRCIAKEAVS